MTVDDPHGAFVDSGRICYEAWMRVSDLPDPIRIRWYGVDRPPPGSYPLTDFSSSDWDDDPKSYDPPLGEQSTTRQPFVDWRDCSGPPFSYPASMEFDGFSIETIPVLGLMDWTPCNLPSALDLDPYPAWTFHPRTPYHWTQNIATTPTTVSVVVSGNRITVSLTSTFTDVGGTTHTFTLKWVGFESTITRPLPLQSAAPWTSLTGDGTAVESATCTIPGYSPVRETQEMIIGMVFTWPSSAALPPKTLECDGSYVLQSDYPELFGILGFAWGADLGDGKFPLPAFPDAVEYGFNPLDPKAIGSPVGNNAHTIVANELPTHTHPVTVTDPGHSHISGSPALGFVKRQNTGATIDLPAGTLAVISNNTSTVQTGITAAAGNNTTTNTPIDLRSAGFVVRKVIYAGR